MKSFEELGVRNDLIQGLRAIKVNEPTEIQQRVIPLLLGTNTDLIAQSQTGTGKTIAFGVPLLQSIDTNLSNVQALILCPTRDLGTQIAKQLFKLTKFTPKIFVESVFGGENIDVQIAALRRTTHIIVATPGRLVELIQKRVVDLSKVHTLIFDEADEMMSMGFAKDLNQILLMMKFVENKWLFSATFPAEIQKVIQQHLKTTAIKITVNVKKVVNADIEHRYIVCEDRDKPFILEQFLRSEGKNRGIVFCRTKITSQNVTQILNDKKISSVALHGDLNQKERQKAMRSFKNGSVQILVTTDLAARGIDVEDVGFVVHYQLPESEAYYIHRSGRTARAGKKGFSLSLINTKEIKIIRNYERTLSIGFKQIRPVR